MGEIPREKSAKRRRWWTWPLRVVAAIAILYGGCFLTSRILLLSGRDFLGSHPGKVTYFGSGTELVFVITRAELDKCNGPLREMVTSANTVKVSCFTFHRASPAPGIPEDPSLIYFSLGRLHWINVFISPCKAAGADAYLVTTVQNVALATASKEKWGGLAGLLKVGRPKADLK